MVDWAKRVGSVGTQFIFYEGRWTRVQGNGGCVRSTVAVVSRVYLYNTTGFVDGKHSNKFMFSVLLVFAFVDFGKVKSYTK